MEPREGVEGAVDRVGVDVGEAAFCRSRRNCRTCRRAGPGLRHARRFRWCGLAAGLAGGAGRDAVGEGASAAIRGRRAGAGHCVLFAAGATAWIGIGISITFYERVGLLGDLHGLFAMELYASLQPLPHAPSPPVHSSVIKSL